PGLIHDIEGDETANRDDETEVADDAIIGETPEGAQEDGDGAVMGDIRRVSAVVLDE
ncbi:hypothetical protein DVH05_021473, partial [Phytophthora capsici]